MQHSVQQKMQMRRSAGSLVTEFPPLDLGHYHREEMKEGSDQRAKKRRRANQSAETGRINYGLDLVEGNWLGWAQGVRLSLRTLVYCSLSLSIHTLDGSLSLQGSWYGIT